MREIVRRVLSRSQEIFKAAMGSVTELTAVEALDKQGSCTSCANLVAALLRACGVPARVLSGYPTWSGPLQTHYIVEAWVPGYGWYPIESTLGREPWQPYQQVAVSVVPPEYEERSQPRPSAAGGVPYLSLTEVVTESVYSDGTMPGRPHCDHGATVFRPLATDTGPLAWTGAFERARGQWWKWLKDPKTGVAGGRLATPRQPEEFATATLADLAR